MRKLITKGAIALGAAVVFGLFAFTSENDSEYTTAEPLYKEKMEFNSNGELMRPSPDLYTSWIFVGSNVAPAELNTGNPTLFPGFHNTYMPPSDFEHFKKTGKFREGTQFIQVNVLTKRELNSGVGYSAGEIHTIKASVKSKKRFPDKPGNWGYFKWNDKHTNPPVASSKVQPTAKCNQCHVAFASDTDFVFLQNYPMLRLYDPNKKVDRTKI
ncbi:cytochrome P460 family protein [Joostella sp.]|uniref:cytochrome P460 family protein n=1 Tax=Joostella sp. TaxID=2231138 RepID=UPI003A93DC71